MKKYISNVYLKCTFKLSYLDVSWNVSCQSILCKKCSYIPDKTFRLIRDSVFRSEVFKVS